MLATFPHLVRIPNLRHVISTRHGGVSEGELGALNLGYHVNDAPARVTENRRRLGISAGYDPDTLVAAQQVHGTNVTWVGGADRGRGAYSWESAVPSTDGLLVTDPGVPIAIQVADCAPVLIVDAVHHVLANVHAGWRGALGGIAAVAVIQMMERAHTRPHDVLVAIGPTLCPDCLEIGETEAAAVEQACGSASVLRGGAKPHLDIHAMLAADLARVGITGDQIVNYPACTRCQVERFFSHRGQQGRAGRFALVAWWVD